MEHLTNSFHQLLVSVCCVFTRPSSRTFLTLMTGWVLSVRHRFVTELIFAGDRVGDGHWSRFHRFFSHAVWSLDDLCLALTKLLLAAFAPDGIVHLALDDTLCRKRGLKLFGAGMHHDPLLSSKAVKLVSWGHDWVVLCLIVRLPAWAPSKTFALPIGFRLYRNLQGNNKGKNQNELDTCSRAPKNQSKKALAKKKKSTQPENAEPHRTRPELGLELLCWLAAAFPQRTFLVAVDNLYGGRSVLSHLPAHVHLISRVHAGGALYEPAPPRASGTRGRTRKKGARLSSMSEWAADDSAWSKLKFDQFGLHAKLSVKTRQGLYYKSGRERLLNFVLVKDDTGKRPMSIFYCTLLDWKARDILSAYANRWSIEVTFENGKQLLGFEDPANRLPKAVQRTAPMAMVLVSLITLWFHQTGHRDVQFPHRPWYTRKREPSFADMLGTLRRLSWTELWQQADLPARAKKTMSPFLAKMIEFLSRPG
jgi:hypothetical protein